MLRNKQSYIHIKRKNIDEGEAKNYNQYELQITSYSIIM